MLAFTHSYVLKKEDQPVCYTHNERYTVEHLLIKFIDLSLIHEKYYQANNMNEFFKRIEPNKIIKSLKETKIYSNIKAMTNLDK